MLFQNTNNWTVLLESLNAGFNSSQVIWSYPVLLILPDVFMFASIFILLIILSNQYKIKNYNLFSAQTKVLKFIVYCSLFLILITFPLILNSSGFQSSDVSPYYQINLFTQSIKFIMLIINIVIINFLPSLLKQSNMPEFPLLFQMLNSLSFIVISTSNLALLLLALEAFSLILYILTTFEHSHGGVTAAVKYFSFGTLGSILLFWGVVHLYAVIPTLSFTVLFSITNLIDNTFIQDVLNFSFNLIIIGFLIKLGAAPLHQWVADVYTGVDILITAIFATLVKFILFGVFIKVTYFVRSGVVIDGFIISSLVVGCYLTLKQSEIKRFIAYSSIVHVGFLLMGDFTSSIIYITTYALSNLVLFSVIVNTRLIGKEILYLNDLKNLRQLGLHNVFLMVAALASAAGLPPFAGFYGKFLTWISLFEDIYLFNDITSYIILLISVVISLITIFYYARAMAYLFIQNDLQSKPFHLINKSSVNNLYSFQVVSLILLCLWTLIQSQLLMFINTILNTFIV